MSRALSLFERLRIRALLDRGENPKRVGFLTGASQPEIARVQGIDPWEVAMRGRKFEDSTKGFMVTTNRRLDSLLDPQHDPALSEAGRRNAARAINRRKPAKRRARSVPVRPPYTDTDTAHRIITDGVLTALTGREDDLRSTRVPDPVPRDVISDHDPLDPWSVSS